MPWEDAAIPQPSESSSTELPGEAFPVEFPPEDSAEENMSFADEQSLFADFQEDGLPWN